MIKATITLDDKNYGGESLEDVVVGSNNGSHRGWYDRNLGEVSALIIGCDEPKQIISLRNLKSDIEKIVRRIEDKHITVKRIVIEIDND